MPMIVKTEAVADDLDLFCRVVAVLQGLSEQDQKLMRDALTRAGTNIRRTVVLAGFDTNEKPAILRTLLGVSESTGLKSLQDDWKTGAIIEYERGEGAPEFWEHGEDGVSRHRLNAETFRERARYDPKKNDIYHLIVSGDFSGLVPGVVVVDTPAIDRTPTAVTGWPLRIGGNDIAALVRVGAERPVANAPEAVEAALRPLEETCPAYRVWDRSAPELEKLRLAIQHSSPPSTLEQRVSAIRRYLKEHAVPALDELQRRATQREEKNAREQRYQRELHWYLEEFRDAAEELILNQKRDLTNDLRLHLVAHPITKTGLILESRREALLGSYFAAQLAPRLQLLLRRQAREFERKLAALGDSETAGNASQPPVRFFQEAERDVHLGVVTTSVLIAASPQLAAGALSLTGWNPLGASAPVPLGSFPDWKSVSLEASRLAKATGIPAVLDEMGEQMASQLRAVHGALGESPTVSTGLSLLFMQKALLGFGTAVVAAVRVKEHFVLTDMEDEIQRVLDDLGRRLHESIGEFEKRIVVRAEIPDDHERAGKALKLLDEIRALPDHPTA